jgi:hypothetical protein
MRAGLTTCWPILSLCNRLGRCLEGFNVSPVAPGGRILEHSCNEDELRLATNAWIGGSTLNKTRPRDAN